MTSDAHNKQYHTDMCHLDPIINNTEFKYSKIVQTGGRVHIW